MIDRIGGSDDLACHRLSQDFDQSFRHGDRRVRLFPFI